MVRKLLVNRSTRLFSTNNPRQLWNVLRNSGISESPDDNSNIDVDELNEFFLSHQSKFNSDNETVFEARQHEFSFQVISPAALRSAFNKIKSIPLNLPKIIFPRIEHVLLHIVNCIISASVFPDFRKIAWVVPIKKQGSSTEFSNMRPIRVLPILSKIVEIVMKEQPGLSSNSLEKQKR